MKWYLFLESIWHRLDNASLWLYLRLKFDWSQQHEWMLDFCYRQESSIREKRRRKYQEQSIQHIINDISRSEQKQTRSLIQELARRGEQ
jgi:hypothetical protein